MDCSLKLLLFTQTLFFCFWLYFHNFIPYRRRLCNPRYIEKSLLKSTHLLCVVVSNITNEFDMSHKRNKTLYNGHQSQIYAESCSKNVLKHFLDKFYCLVKQMHSNKLGPLYCFDVAGNVCYDRSTTFFRMSLVEGDGDMFKKMVNDG